MLTFNYNRLVEACQKTLPGFNIFGAEAARSKFLSNYGEDALAAVTEDTALDFYNSGKQSGLFWNLEYNTDLGAFGRVSGGSANKWIVYRGGGGWMKAKGGDGKPCPEAEARSEIFRILRTLYAATLAVQYFHLPTSDPKQWSNFQKAVDKTDFAFALGQEALHSDVLDKGWAHKYLALLHPDIFSFTHSNSIIAHHLIRLTGQVTSAKRYLLDEAWREMRLEDEYLKTLPPVIVSNAAFEQIGRETEYVRLGTLEGNGSTPRWQKMYNGGFASIGWHYLGDLKDYFGDNVKADTQNILEERITKGELNGSNKSVVTSSIRQLRQFYTLPYGTRIVAMQGKNILGTGIVDGPYEYVPSDQQQPHHRRVHWLETNQEGWPDNPKIGSTIYSFKDKWSLAAFIERRVAQALQKEEEKPMNDNPVYLGLPDEPLNQILYGPPGTGKTYTTIDKAIEIVEGKQDTHQIAKQRWDAMRHDGRIGFVTFHQSYGYEDFIEGIRPATNDEDGATRYAVQEGVLKAIALTALADCLETISIKAADAATPSSNSPSPMPFADAWEELLEEIDAKPDNSYSDSKGQYNYRLERGERRTSIKAWSLNNQGRATPDRTNFDTVAFVCQNFEDLSQVRPSDVMQKRQNLNGNYSAALTVARRIEQIQKDASGKPAAPTPQASSTPLPTKVTRAGAQDFLTRGESSGYRLKPTDQQPRYILVIDEINRGNISRILGELITLLEEDKRLGAANALTVTLPFSGDTFGLPPNLYLLGTMNTADKSIALVDIALRRRFTFQEIRPRFDTQTCPGMTAENVPEGLRVMTEMNRRILLRKDRDHRIGHAYFARVDSKGQFNKVMRDCILPLLAEYFWGDWDGLRYVLGESGEAASKTGFVRATSTDREVRNRWQWYFDAEDEAALSGVEEFDPLENLIKHYLPAASSAAPVNG